MTLDRLSEEIFTLAQQPINYRYIALSNLSDLVKTDSIENASQEQSELITQILDDLLKETPKPSKTKPSEVLEEALETEDVDWEKMIKDLDDLDFNIEELDFNE